jgi:cell division protein FtsB
MDETEIETMARERLGLVMPGETIYYFTDEESKKDKEG